MKENITRKKLYKSGKVWVAAATVSAIIGMVGGATTKVSADTVAATVDNNVKIVTKTEPVTKSAETDKAVVDTTKSAETDKAVVDTTKSAETDKAVVDTTKSAETDKAVVDTTKSAETDKTIDDLNIESKKPKLTDLGNKLLLDAAINNQTLQNLTDQQITSLNAAALKYYDNPNKMAEINTITYKHFDDLINQLNEQPVALAVPKFNSGNIKNLPAVTTKSAQTGEVANLDIWDSWMVQDAITQRVAEIKGYQVMFALAGLPSNPSDTHLYMLSAPYKATAISDWKMVGPVFGYEAVPWNQEWSGSATLNDNETIQLFYTRVQWNNDLRQNMQKIHTVNIVVKEDENKTLYIKNIKNDHLIFEGDGKNYQQIEQTFNVDRDNFTLRDPHVIEVDGTRYLAFESNTGTDKNSGYDNVTDLSNYGGSLNYNVTKLLEVSGNEETSRVASLANGALGLVRLTNVQDNPTVDHVYGPLITSNIVTDEIERANIVPLNGKYYLFTDTRVSKSSLESSGRRTNVSDVAMLGYVSDTIFGSYKPLNGNGAVLLGNTDYGDRADTYSYYAVPVTGYSDRLLVTSYMSNRNYAAGENLNATTAPSFIIKINDNDTTSVEQTITAQNDWVDPYNAIDSTMYGFPGQNVNFKRYINSSFRKDGMYLNAPYGANVTNEQGYNLISVNVGSTAQYNGENVMITKQYVTNDAVTWYLTSLNNQSVWIDSRAFTSVPLKVTDMMSFVTFDGRNDGMYINAPYGMENAKYVGQIKDYNGTAFAIKAQYNTRGVTWNLLQVDGQEVWIDNRSFATNFTREVNNRVFVNSVNRTDGLYSNGTYGQINARWIGNTKKYNSQIATVTKQYYDDKGIVWNQVILGGQTVWVDNRAFTQLQTQDIKQQLYINSNQRTDSLYANMPYRGDGSRWVDRTTSFNGQCVDAIKQGKDAYGVTWNLIKLNGQELWVDKNALTTTYTQNLNMNMYVNSSQRTDGLYISAPYGVKNAKWVGNTKSINGQYVNISQQYANEFGVTFYLANLHGQNTWIDKRAFSTTFDQIVAFNATISTRQRADGMYLNSAYGETNSKYTGNVSQYNNQKVTVTKEHSDAKGVVWYLANVNNQQVWIDKRSFSSVVTKSVAYSATITLRASSDGMYLNAPYGETNSKFVDTTSNNRYKNTKVQVTEEYTNSKGVTWNLIKLNGNNGQQVWIDKRAFKI
ncbi:glycoside hydrolase family 68 protein [Leuconostoc gelidum]|uniref:glycoside hydrolase family 68 protein n=4 Tax=Leuconostoc gelidum TaxID=1244 RepID=UPI00027E6C47|nr:glycoside hydrolase family 68 protein [Leuconostoc gelidum]AFS39644.1 levansucrase/Inulosucrase [Leuconostoc gelidum JB7]